MKSYEKQIGELLGAMAEVASQECGEFEWFVGTYKGSEVSGAVVLRVSWNNYAIQMSRSVHDILRESSIHKFKHMFRRSLRKSVSQMKRDIADGHD